MMKYLALLFILICSMSLKAQTPMIDSDVFHWEDFTSKAIFEGASDGFEYLKIAVVTIAPGDNYTLSKQSKPLESLIIMKSGTLDQSYGKSKATLGNGSVTVLTGNQTFKMKNKTSEVATFYLLNWRIHDYLSKTSKDEFTDGYMIDWDTIEFIETDKGGRRSVIREPTPMLNEFEMHVTTLNEGMRSHLPHTHLDEEIILLRYGKAEESIDGNLHNAGEGSFFFLRSMVPHGIRNIGEGPCEYYAFRWIPRE